VLSPPHLGTLARPGQNQLPLPRPDHRVVRQLPPRLLVPRHRAEDRPNPELLQVGLDANRSPATTGACVNSRTR
jgi:hypothetical protein